MSNLELKGLKLLRTLEKTFSDEEVSLPVHGLVHLAIELLSPGRYQPRKQFDDVVLEELANSIKAQGIIQPLIVRKIAEDHYEIIAGERRWRAAKIAGFSYVPAIIREVEDDIAFAFSLIENIQRENLNPVEEAIAFNRFHEEFHMTHEEISHMVGRSRASITNSIRLLSLEARVREMLEEGKINMGHARSLLKLEPERQYEVACMVVAKELSVRETEFLASKNKQQNQVSTTIVRKKYHAKCDEWGNFLSKQFSTHVSVKVNTEGKGKLVFEVNSVDEVDWLIQMMTNKD